jgi:hypothetical protein
MAEPTMPRWPATYIFDVFSISNFFLFCSSKKCGKGTAKRPNVQILGLKLKKDAEIFGRMVESTYFCPRIKKTTCTHE